MNKKILKVGAILSLVLLLTPLTVSALIIPARETIIIPQDEIIDENLVAVADSITINGQVNGDVIVAGNTIKVNGDVQGDVIAVGNFIEINGQVAGNIRAIGNIININNNVGKNVTALGQNITVAQESSIGWSFLAATSRTEIFGEVSGNVTVYGETIIINNTIGNNLTLNLGDAGLASLNSKTTVNGNFIYHGTKNAKIDPNAVIKGETIHKLLSSEVLQAREFLSGSWFFFKIIGLFSILLIGTIIISLYKNKTMEIANQMWQRPGSKILKGFAILIVTPIAVVILTLTVIGGPLALIITMGYFILIYLSKIYIGVAIGKKLLAAKKKEVSLIWIMMLGIFFYALLVNIPYVGWLVALIGTTWFLGSIWDMKLSKSPNSTMKSNEKN
ncbi:hypothetical protein IID19_00815 [Patescibacteria group bacterium]|nr:hypothetical protein [Patescibacteria group bacterium]